MKIGLRFPLRSLRTLAAAPLVLVLACAPKPVTLRVQGTVQTVGSKIPIAGANVLIQWPATLGGGESRLTTDRSGHFVTGRTLRKSHMDCAGLTLTVQVADFAAAYDRHADQDCGKDAVLDFTVNMLRQPG
jgi:hypothetical protein